MKPILLKLKGLNSFIEEQVVDFEDLTSRGLFGIFGPTGSGKTTILDGITLALYGEVARQSSNFINTNCKSASVLFEFQISGATPRRYVVEREFKQDTKTGSYKTGKCRLSEITEGQEEIIAEKVRDVTNSIVDIIGLKLDDFQRTVVLPQGKFSDFLKLDGQKRSNMLERLFQLQPYGDELTTKLRERKRKELLENENLEGQILAHNGVSEDVIKEREQEHKTLTEYLNEEQKRLEEYQKIYNEASKVWKLQLDLKKLNEEKEKLFAQRSYMEQEKQVLQLSERARRVKPYIEAFDSVQKEFNQSDALLAKSKKQLVQISEKRNEVIGQWEIYNKKKQEELPLLLEREKEVNDGIQLELDMDENKLQLKESLQKVNLRTEETAVLKEQLQACQQEIERLNVEIAQAESMERELQIDAVLRQNVSKGCVLAEKIETLSEQVKKEKERFDQLEHFLKEESQKAAQMQKILYEKEEEKGIQALQGKLIDAKDQWKRYFECEKEEERICGQLELLSKEEEKITDLVSEQEGKVILARENLKSIEIENLAHMLRKELKDDSPCPVCGSTHYKLPCNDTMGEEGKLKEAEEKKNQEEKEFELLKQRQAEIKAQLQNFRNQLEATKQNVIGLGQEYKKYTQEEIEEKLSMILPYRDLFTQIKENQKSYESLKVSLKELQDQKESWEKEFEQIKVESNIDDFEKKQQDIQEADNKLRKVQERLAHARKQLNVYTAQKNEKNEQQMNVIKDLATYTETSRQLDGIIKKQEEKWTSFIIKHQNELIYESDTPKLKRTLENILNSIQEIESRFKSINERKESLEMSYQEINERYIKLSANNELLKKQVKEEERRLGEALEKEMFDCMEDCIAKMLPDSLFESKKVEVEQYEKEVIKILGLIEDTTKRIGNDEVKEEEWNEIQEQLEKSQLEVDSCKEKIFRIAQELDDLKKRYQSLKELMEKQKEMEHQLSLLDELEKLFRGKRFVEYVAQSRLEYISRGASKRLREISNGTYGLEVSETGKFIICDYKNGGVKRDASTLSGGETFLVSLSLALSLSEQVQLKGTAPLELFFLDEGFGTLDDELLDVVMDSLEKVQNEKLKVGIISHVESVKNRVPVKLLVTPARSGMGGTKVAIERT